jgi:hypothetical protein
MFMSFANEWNRVLFVASLAGFFAILALNLTVPITVVSVMGLVDRMLMRLWSGIEAARQEEQPA